MVEYDSCGPQNMISADAEVRAVLTAVAGKMRSCKRKHVAPEGDEAEIGKYPSVSPFPCGRSESMHVVLAQEHWWNSR
jgi:hypothetical protein